MLVPKTTDWKDEGKLRYLLAHEYVHIRRFDTLINSCSRRLFASTGSTRFLGHVSLVNRDIELACDEAVLRESEAAKNRITP